MWSFGPLSRLTKFMEDEMGVQGSTKPLLPHESLRDPVMTGVGRQSQLCLKSHLAQCRGFQRFWFMIHAGPPPQCSGGWFRAGFIKDAKDHIVHPAVKNIVKLQPERSRCLETEKE